MRALIFRKAFYLFLPWAEAIARRCSVKKVFLEILQNSQENACARVSFLNKFQGWGLKIIKKSFWHSCSPVNFAKFLRTSFWQNTSGRLLLPGNSVENLDRKSILYCITLANQGPETNISFKVSLKYLGLSYGKYNKYSFLVELTFK